MSAMRIFIDEFLTGGGLLSRPNWGDCDSLLREGAAMVQAIAEDFARLDGIEVHVKRDARLAGLRFPECRVTDVDSAERDRVAFARLTAAADWTLVIAPEIDRVLLDRCQQAVAAGGRLIGPDLELIALFSDKQRTAEFLGRQGVAVPAGIALQPGELLPADFDYPAVVKPRDGAGSMGVRLVADRRQARAICVEWPSRLEPFCRGQACSVSVVCGPEGATPLAPFTQRLSQDGHFRYLGGERLEEPQLAARAQRLAMQATACFPAARGYVGIDLVLGPQEDGSLDRLIEINPRLTTSYLGLRRCVRGNLAGMLLAAAREEPVPIDAIETAVAFSADGSIGTDFDSLGIVT